MTHRQDLARTPGGLRAQLDDRVLVFDGAMGTMLHAAGAPLDRSLCELNLSQPGLVRDLHGAYIAAGAHVVQTNTFDANRLRLARFGGEDNVVEINIAGARLAREAAQAGDRAVLVAGSVGPATNASAVPRLPLSRRATTLSEQIAALSDWVDLLVLETYGDVESLAQAVEVARQESDLPVIAQLTFGDDGRTLRGEDPSEAASALDGHEVVALGANCTVGPAVLQDVVAELAKSTSVPVSVQPNAGVPLRLGRQVRYVHNTDYFAQAAQQFVASGANVVGGCCGTTPAHIRAVAKAVESVRPTRRVAPESVTAVRASGRGAVAEPAAPERATWPEAGGFTVIGGLQAPRGEDVQTFVDHAQQLRSAGVSVVALADPAPPSARVNPVAAGVVLRERVGVEVLLPLETVDRSYPVLQADLLGAHALGLQYVVCRTGAPRVVGDYPDPNTLWDVDSVGLIGVVRGLNEGVDYRGVATSERTRFVVGATLNPAPADMRRELDRAAEKVQAGADFLLTDVIYDADEARELLTALPGHGIEVPVIGAVAPFADIRTLERLSHEMPEVSIPQATLADLRRISEHPDEAVDVTLRALDGLHDLVAGVSVHVPTNRTPYGVELIGELVRRGSRR